MIFVPVLTTLTTLADAGFEPADNALIIFAEDGADARRRRSASTQWWPSCRS